MLCKYGKQTRDFWGVFNFSLVYFPIFWGFLINQLCHSRLWLYPTRPYGPHWLFTISYPTRAHGIIVKYFPIFKTAHVVKKIWRIINTIASIWGENMLGFLFLNIICSSRLTVTLSENCTKVQYCGLSKYLDRMLFVWELIFWYFIDIWLIIRMIISRNHFLS